MRIDPKTLPAREVYNWMTHTVIPRPIAWVSTISPNGALNLAPFSFFQGITSSPPTLMFVPANTRDGAKKDTLVNIEATSEFVVNLVSEGLGEKMNATAAMLPYGESEFAAFGVEPLASEFVKPPRVAGSPVSFECRLHSIVRIGEGPLAGNVVFGLIQCIHVHDDVIGPSGYPDPLRLKLISRLGGNAYARTTDSFEMTRPGR